jgi:hypothetical protein
MAVSELGSVAEIERWEAPVHRSWISVILSGIVHFARKKPLGFVGGCVVIMFMFAAQRGSGNPCPILQTS